MLNMDHLSIWSSWYHLFAASDIIIIIIIMILFL